MSQFYTLEVEVLKRLTSDSVLLGFKVPEELKETFSYKPGQYLTLKFNINDKEERRAYSLCSSPYSDTLLEVAVKEVENGLVSTHINRKLKQGDKVEVMPPQGNFIIEINPEQQHHYTAFAAGSGITPIMSMIKSVLEKEPKSKFTLIYGNKTQESTIFYKELKELEGERFKLISVYTRQDSGEELTNGRIDTSKVEAIIKNDLELLKADGFYMCGPEEMIVAVADTLKDFGVSKDKIHYELFTTPTLLVENKPQEKIEFNGVAKVKVIYDDEEVEFELKADGETILDAATKEDLDVPFSCKGAVCCTCKALVTEGKATMEANYSLSDAEVEEGYILTCQAHPATPTLVVDFDEA